jgi:hypothetical protein
VGKGEITTGNVMEDLGAASSVAGLASAPFTGGLTALLPMVLGATGALSSAGGGLLNDISAQHNAFAQNQHNKFMQMATNNAARSALASQPIGFSDKTGFIPSVYNSNYSQNS